MVILTYFLYVLSKLWVKWAKNGPKSICHWYHSSLTLHKYSAQKKKECVAVLTVLYKKNGAVSCVGSHFLSDWALYTAHPRPVVIKKPHMPSHIVRWYMCQDIKLDLCDHGQILIETATYSYFVFLCLTLSRFILILHSSVILPNIVHTNKPLLVFINLSWLPPPCHTEGDSLTIIICSQDKANMSQATGKQTLRS